MLPYHGEIPEEIVGLVGQKFSYAELCRQCCQLEAKYPALKFFSAGQSVLGKPLWCLRIGEGARNVHLNAAVHANEWITAPVLLRFVEDYAAALSAAELHADHKWRHDAPGWFRDCTLWVMPMVNPDGADLAQDGVLHCNAYKEKLLSWNGGSEDFSRWKANVRGVDLNDQFPAFWEAERARRGVSGPSPQDYGGEAPLSEPEAAALARLTEVIRPEMVFSIHSQGREIYWNYRDFEPDCSENLAEQLAGAGGYRAVKLGGSDAGYKDWFIQQYRRPGFTVEIGEGVNPLPAGDFAELCSELSAILTKALSIPLF